MSGMFNVMDSGLERAGELTVVTGGPTVQPANLARDQQLVEWNDTASDFPKARFLHDLFAEQAARTPAAIALEIDDKRLTYADLDRRANQVAHYLRSIGVGPEVIVGLCVERSLETIVGLLGILKAGGAYLPLGQNHPEERVAYLLKDSGVSTVLTSLATDPLLAAHNVRRVTLNLQSKLFEAQPKTAPPSTGTSENLAYVIYTSGSSGQPKGVCVTHYNVSRLVLNTNYVEILPHDVFLQLAPVTFDASTFEIWGALLNGAKLALYPPDPLLDLLKLKTLIQNAKVSVLWLTAGLFHSIVDGDLSLLSGVKQLLAGGDVISAGHVKRVLAGISGCRVINGYGPTEGTTFSVCFPVPDSSSMENTVPIGRPVSNTTVYVLDSGFEPAPIGDTGKLYIGGAGLSRGYLQRPDLTAESFVPNPFGEHGSRLYSTGDIVSYFENGVLEFVGRIDFQVKVRGYRIELEEVEAALRSESSVRQAAVVASPDPAGDKRLVAYVVAVEGVALDTKRLRESLSLRLPDYMVPSVWVVLKALPLTANGKVDRKALPSLERQAESPIAETGIEGAVAEIWSSALGRKNFGTNDDFFELGGTSLGLINIVMRMGKRFGVPLDTSIVTGGATVSALAKAVKEKLATVEHQDPVDQAVAEIWSSALGRKNFGTNDDFFELGGTSLGLINIVMRMGKRFGVPLDTSIVTGGATVSALAKAVKEKLATVEHQDPVDQAVAEIWSSALGRKNFGTNDDFFELGGTSLGLINIVMRMGKRFGVPLDTSIVTGGATVSALAKAVKEKLATVEHQDPVDQAVAEIWSSALGRKNFGTNDDFFELGGTSLGLINIVMRMGKRFGVPLDTSIVTGGATVSALAKAVKEKLATVEHQDPVDQAVAEIWSSALGRKNFGTNDDFFELGGTSLGLINIVMRMGKRFGVPLDTSIVTGGATVSALAKAVKEKLATVEHQDPVDQAVAEIWSSALGRKNFGTNDDFFELGGTSLGLINIVMRMGKRFGVPLDTSIVTGGATVSALAKAVKEKLATVEHQDPVDQAVAEIWSSALGRKNFGTNDDFFELGGTSLGLINIVMRMGKRFGVPLDTSIVTGGATVSALAKAVKEKLATVEHQDPVDQAVAETWAAMW